LGFLECGVLPTGWNLPCIKDALKGTAFDHIDEMLLRLYYIYERSPKKCRELEEIVTHLKECLSTGEGRLSKLIAMYNIVNGTEYFLTGYFVQTHFPYSSNHGFNYTIPFARTNCFRLLFHL